MWGDVDGYDRFMGRYSSPLAVAFVDRVGVASGQRALDVGCGPGALTRVLAERAGAGNVAGVDPTEAFVEQTRLRVPAADLRVAPAEAIPFEDDTFDRALSQLVFHFVQDPAAAVAEMKRVTRPGGRVAACVWDREAMTMIRSYWEAAREIDPNASPAGDRFGSEPGQLSGLWHDAGLRDVEDGSLTVSSTYEDFEELWGAMLSAPGPIGVHRASLDDAGREELRAALRRRVGSPQGPFELSAAAWYAVGTV
jgi:SAM-dependent methyltransferase